MSALTYEDLRVLDFYTLIENKPEVYSPDGVHLKIEGYKAFAQAICDLTKEILNKE